MAHPAAKQKAKAASSASWSGYEEWKETRSLGACTKAGAVVSKTWYLNRRSVDAKVCVTDLSDNMITESKKLYAGTDMEGRFLVFHGALAHWSGGEAQLYIRTRYPGFENARGLDSCGFTDLKYAMSFNCALTWPYPYGDVHRIFGQGTPKGMWHLMEQTWTAMGVPANARIMEGISGWGLVCDRAIEAKGTIAPRRELPDRPPRAEDARRGGT